MGEQDVSPNNIMFYRTEHEGAVGVMCDWDLAAQRDELMGTDVLVDDMIKSLLSPAKLLLLGIRAAPLSAVSIQPVSLNLDVPEGQSPRHRDTGQELVHSWLSIFSHP